MREVAPGLSVSLFGEGGATRLRVLDAGGDYSSERMEELHAFSLLEVPGDGCRDVSYVEGFKFLVVTGVHCYASSL